MGIYSRMVDAPFNSGWRELAAACAITSSVAISGSTGAQSWQELEAAVDVTSDVSTVAHAMQPLAAAVDITSSVVIAGAIPQPIAIEQSFSCPAITLTVEDSIVPATYDLNMGAATTTVTLSPTPRATGTTPPTVTISAGASSLSWPGDTCPAILVDILTGATTFDLSFDNGANVAFAAQTIPVGGGDYTIPSGPYAGMVLNFANGTYNANNFYEVAVASITGSGGAWTFAQATAALQPMWFRHATEGGGLWSGRAGGRNTEIVSSDAGLFGIFTSLSPFTVLLRIENDSADPSTNPQYYFSACNSGFATNRSYNIGQNNTETGRYVFTRVDNSAVANSALQGVNGLISADPETVCAICDGTNLRLYRNGTLEPAAVPITGGNLTPNRVSLFCRADTTSDSFARGIIYRIPVFNTALSDAARNAWETLLAA